MYWRLPTYNWTRIVVHLFLGVLFGLIFLSAEYVSYRGINAGLGMLFAPRPSSSLSPSIRAPL